MGVQAVKDEVILQPLLIYAVRTYAPTIVQVTDRMKNIAWFSLENITNNYPQAGTLLTSNQKNFNDPFLLFLRSVLVL